MPTIRTQKPIDPKYESAKEEGCLYLGPHLVIACWAAGALLLGSVGILNPPIKLI